MRAAVALVLVLLVAYQTQAMWSQSCCKCPGVDDGEASDFISLSGGMDEGEFAKRRVGLSTEKQQLLDLHNEYRRRVAQGRVPGQPGSSKIRDLKWNSELEASAQRHANRCEFRHDSKGERRTPQWSWVGQNIAYAANVADDVQLWFDEHSDYNYRSNYCSGLCGHYTQLVWANTTHVGCGVSRCNFSGFNAVFTVCNYGPGGNFNGLRPY